MEPTTDPTSQKHAAVRFSGPEWGALTMQQRGEALQTTRETAATGVPLAKKLRRQSRQRLNRGVQPHDVGPVVLAWPEEGARGNVWVPE